MLTLLLTLTAQADEAVTPAPTAEAEVSETEKSAPMEIGIIELSGRVHEPEIVIITPRITTQESSVAVLSALIDERLAAEEARR